MEPSRRFLEYYARISDDGCAKQLLQTHLRNVAGLACSFIEEACRGNMVFSKTACLAGLLHDLGKYRDEFQDCLAGNRPKDKDTAHSVYGAAAAGLRFDSVAAAYAIAGHHAGLHNEEHLALLMSGAGFQASERFVPLLARAEELQEVGRILPVDAIGFDEDDACDRRCYEFATRMLFSALVDADRLDSERFEQEQRLGRPWQRRRIPLQAQLLLERLRIARSHKAATHPNDELNRLRNTIFDTCVQRGRELPRGFFTLTVPTGGGKTLSSMAFALAHASRHDLRRVIVVIPYLSIIEQNARQYRTIFGADHVLEHHSAVEPPHGVVSEPADMAVESSYTARAELAMENWDVPIVVTTSVQFIETLFAASPSRARRLHNVARSVVVFDEVQTLPVHLLNPMLDVLRELAQRYDVSLLFCSATQPAFLKSAGLPRGFEPHELNEIAPDSARSYRTLRRVRYRVEPVSVKWSWERVADEMLANTQALCVLNLRRQAFAGWEAVRKRLAEEPRSEDWQDAVFHLSSAMCPAHRLDVLGLSRTSPPNNITMRLRTKQPCWVVSTQLIEAGVDIDFPVVFRAMGPLDSIVQSGGRCNREGQLTDGQGCRTPGNVIVFHPEDGGLPRGIYEKATSITPAYTVDVERLATDPDLFASYFSELYQLTPTDHARKGEHSIQEDRAAFNFRTVSERARVIKEDTVSVIVPYRRAKKLVAQVRRMHRCDARDLRRFQRYMVSLRRGHASDLEQLAGMGALEPLLPGALEIPVLADWCYDAQRGVVAKDRSPEDFII